MDDGWLAQLWTVASERGTFQLAGIHNTGLFFARFFGFSDNCTLHDNPRILPKILQFGGKHKAPEVDFPSLGFRKCT